MSNNSTPKPITELPSGNLLGLAQGTARQALAYGLIDREQAVKWTATIIGMDPDEAMVELTNLSLLIDQAINGEMTNVQAQ